jgi:hypothetical protein
MQRELGIERSWRAVAVEGEDVNDRLVWWMKGCVWVWVNDLPSGGEAIEEQWR